MKQEHKDKISKANKGKSKQVKHDKQFKKGHIPWNVNNGVRLNDALIEWRKNGGESWNKGLKGADNPNTGRKISEESIAKMKIAAKKRGEKIRKYKFIDDRDEHGHGKIECICIDCKQPTPKRPSQLKKWSGRCLDCAKKHRKANAKGKVKKRQEVECKKCKIKWEMRGDQMYKWKGYCKVCCQAIKHSTPEQKERCRINLKIQREKNPERYVVKPKYGAEHWNWKGDLVSKHKRIRGSLEYKAWRKSVFERDNYTCQFCQDRGVVLHADHIKPFAEYPDLRMELSNGRTLCVPCHKKTETYGVGRRKKAAA